MRNLWLVALALGAGALLPPASAARTEQTTISISAQTANSPVGGLVWANAGKAATISGDTGDGQAGTAVELQASKFPFTSGFATIGQNQTGSGGSYSFTATPTLATRYRVVLVSDATSQSSVVTVYVASNWISHASRCVNGTFSCQLHISAHVVYPAGTAKREGKKLVYYYFGVRSGSQTTPPARVKLVKKSRQHHRGHQYRVGFSVKFPTPTAFSYRWEICTKDTEAHDGLGLPGRHHCGARSISQAALAQGYIG
jgi:hypothetical protein